MNPRRLFVASCIALITSAFSFMIRQDITDPLAAEFAFTKEDVGQVMGAAFLGMALIMVVVAPLCDVLGMGRVLALAWLCHLAGILGTIFAPKPPVVSSDMSFWWLFLATFLVGSGNGLVEIAINPLAATLYPKEKTHYLNVLHAWWPGGLILSGLLATFAVNPLLGLKADGVDPATASLGWKIKMALLLVPLLIYGIMCLGQRFPQTERVQANVSTGEMFREALRPMFLLWAFCMLLTASTELGPNQWQESVLTRTANVSGTLVFVYTSGLMFGMRFFAGPLAHQLSPVGMLTVSALLSAVGLYWLSVVNAPLMAFVASTVFGVGIAYFWPTMLGVTAERFPKGGALLLGLMGSFGNLAIFVILPQMGAIYDSYTVANLPPALRQRDFTGPDGKKEPLVLEGSPSRLPTVITSHLFPAGSQKLNPVVQKLLADDEKQTAAAPRLLTEDERKAIRSAEAIGAANAFRWVAVLPTLLILVFGAIALGDRMSGGYKAVDIIQEGTQKEATPL